MLIDTHAHLDDDSFDDCRSDVVARALEAGVERVITIGCTVADSEKCVRVASEFDSVSAAVGIQPNYVGEMDSGDWDKIVELSKAEHVVAIGETGLDHYWDRAPLEPQEDLFRRHVELSQQTGLPFIVHMRDRAVKKNQPPDTSCQEHIWKVLCECAENANLNGVMHSYSGNAEYAQRFLDLGMYVSFAGMVTFKNSSELRDVAKLVPDDRILVETDSPYLSPEPLRGKRPNEPARVVHTAKCLADVRGVSESQFGAMTTANARRLFDRLP